MLVIPLISYFPLKLIVNITCMLLKESMQNTHYQCTKTDNGSSNYYRYHYYHYHDPFDLIYPFLSNCVSYFKNISYLRDAPYQGPTTCRKTHFNCSWLCRYCNLIGFVNDNGSSAKRDNGSSAILAFCYYRYH